MNIAELKVNVWDYNEQLVEIPMFQLLQWRGALKLEARGMKHSKGNVTKLVREKLSIPESDQQWTAETLAEYIGQTIDDIKQQLGVSDG